MKIPKFLLPIWLLLWCCSANVVMAEEEEDTSEPWDELSLEEVAFVESFLSERYNLSSFMDPTANHWVNNIFISAQLEEPPKAEVLAYLDNDEEALPPLRYARAFASFGQGTSGFIHEFRVGPLNTDSNNVTDDVDVDIEILTKEGELPLSLKRLGFGEFILADLYVGQFLKELDGFMMEAFGDPYHGSTRLCAALQMDCPETTMSVRPFEFGSYRNETSYQILLTRYTPQLDNEYSYPLPFSFLLDTGNGGGNVSAWEIRDVVYLDQYWATGFEFVLDYFSGSIDIVPVSEFDRDSNPEWQTLQQTKSADRRGPENNLPPPINVQPEVSRFTVKDDRWVEWMGWSFYLKTKARTGAAFYDVQFLKERIAYEISLQELHAGYTGGRPEFAKQSYFDSFFRLSETALPLTPGVDCPADATFVGAFCIFEHDAGMPIWRHFRADVFSGQTFYSGAQKTHLVVRTIYTVGNYDYIVDATFHLDGSVDLGFSASGHLYLGYYQPKEEIFGTRIHDEVYAPLHSHFGGFKVDLDILDEQDNCVQKTSVGYTDRSDLVNEPSYLSTPAKSMFLKRELVLNEDDARIAMSLTEPKELAVVSCNETNAWGYRRGYKILNQHSLSILDAPRFPRYNMFFTQQKDSEPELTGIFDSKTMMDPVVVTEGDGSDDDDDDDDDRAALINGESLDGEDVVAWVSVGFYHIPVAEDSPIVNIVEGSFSIAPANYFDSNPAMDLQQSVRFDPAALLTEQMQTSPEEESIDVVSRGGEWGTRHKRRRNARLRAANSN